MNEQEFVKDVLENNDSAEIIIETEDGEEYKIVAGQLFYTEGQDNVDIYTFSDFGLGNIFDRRLDVLALKVYNYLKGEEEVVTCVYGG